jgi:opacity protein-like surface antigen
MRSFIRWLVIAGIVSTGSLAFAQEVGEEEPSLFTRYGMSAFVGGGIAGFSDEDVSGMTGTAGIWGARLQFGTRLPFSVEASYVGAAQSIDALGLDTDALLVSTNVEGTVRYNIPLAPGMQPYVFAGLGWTRFDLTNVDTNTSSVEDQDDVLAVPLGLGFAYRYAMFIADVRGTYRIATYEDLVPAADNPEGKDSLDTWGVALNAGFEF